MDGGSSSPLVGSEIHGFRSLADLDVQNMMEEAKSRWLRPNEIHAILCNHKYFPIYVKPVKLPKSGTIVFFDRKMLRNFRKDGHNWKKKKDGKTVKEAHEHLKVGNEERIHVYYAHGLENPTFVRRCYWLLDKSLEHIVLVHYRGTQEGSPATPGNSNSSSLTDQSTPLNVVEEFDSAVGNVSYEEPNNSVDVKNHERRLHEINTLDWDELLITNDSNDSAVSKREKNSYFEQLNQTTGNGFSNDQGNNAYFNTQGHNLSTDISMLVNLVEPRAQSNNAYLNPPVNICNPISSSQLNPNVLRKDTISTGTGESLHLLINDGLQSQDSFGKWMNYATTESPVSVGDSLQESSVSSVQDSFTSPEQIFSISEVSHAWAYSTEKTKILITGAFHQAYQHLAKSNLFCVCGDICYPVESIQVGVYRCVLSQHPPGLVNLYMSLDGHKPTSQVLSFEYHAPLSPDPLVPAKDESMWEEFRLQTRLAYLLFSTSKNLNILSGKVSPNTLKEAKSFAQKTSSTSNSWTYLLKSIEENRASFTQAKDSLFEIALKNRLKDWLLERIIEGCKTTEFDTEGLGVLHLCAILGYTWAIYLFSWSGLSLDFRDKHGWTALHWAAYHGREKMVAVLLSAGAKPNLVTDPSTQNPNGCTAADLASSKGYEGLAAYLSEEALVTQFNDMAVAGNASGSLQTSRTETTNTNNTDKLNEDELYLKQSLAAYRTAADAAARIQNAFRTHSLKIRTNIIESSTPEEEARNIVAAMKIQHAFRNFEAKRQMAAAARIQYRFHTWKMRREFLNMRRHAIRIQAAFRGLLTRKQYRKIVWSVGVLEKAVLRWRLKRKGLRGLQNPVDAVPEQRTESDTEEDFFRTSRKQAEQRVEKAVVCVQAMFRSKKAQQDYRQMKLAHDLALVSEFSEIQQRLIQFCSSVYPENPTLAVGISKPPQPFFLQGCLKTSRFRSNHIKAKHSSREPSLYMQPMSTNNLQFEVQLLWICKCFCSSYDRAFS
ncbi:calmodulin-binding transcription activator 5-like isoform X3 [Hibiscus syriacus]|uniref:calmodulin-binding transcription activator 5-like isoform X3 n=1 Tax=Hibiscus syriacus TaxID=106335 RepID=UPI0019220E40|nr:calmodulin-binding transcription activator 5-like isoform X3 [Hibiscus syriacus]